MARTFVAALLVTAFVVSGEASYPRPTHQVKIQVEPDPRQLRPLDRWPDAADLARLQSVKGKPKAVILQTLGHPSRVERRPDGEEIWDYPWCAACYVRIRKGICTDTFYQGGY